MVDNLSTATAYLSTAKYTKLKLIECLTLATLLPAKYSRSTVYRDDSQTCFCSTKKDMHHRMVANFKPVSSITCFKHNFFYQQFFLLICAMVRKVPGILLCTKLQEILIHGIFPYVRVVRSKAGSK